MGVMVGLSVCGTHMSGLWNESVWLFSPSAGLICLRLLCEIAFFWPVEWREAGEVPTSTIVVCFPGL